MLKMAVSSLTFDGFGDNDFTQTFALARKVGYQRVEFNCWYPQLLTPSRIRELKKRCEEAGLIPISLHVTAFGGDSNDVLTMNVCHKLRAIEAAVELGCRRVVASCMEHRSPEGLSAVIKELDILAPVAAEADVLLCLENHCNNVLENAQDYRDIFAAVNASHIGICLDTGHFDAAGVDIDKFIDEFSHKINHIHLKENNGFGIKRFCRFGTGTTDNVKAVKRLLAKGYSGYMAVELSPEIGETGDSVAFGIADWAKPIELFAGLEIG